MCYDHIWDNEPEVLTELGYSDKHEIGFVDPAPRGGWYVGVYQRTRLHRLFVRAEFVPRPGDTFLDPYEES